MSNSTYLNNVELQPVHKSYDHIPKGIKIKRLDSSETSYDEGERLHSDEYYVFGLVESGRCEIQVDFTTIMVGTGEGIIISPSQMHRIVSVDDANGYAMLIDASLVGETESKSLVTFTRKGSLVKPPSHLANILDSLFSTLYSTNSDCIELSNSFRVHIGQAIIEAFCCLIETAHRHEYGNNRYSRHADTFFKLLESDITLNRRPSYYAQKMNISPVYLNEAIKTVTGKNVSENINEEIVLRAKRLLAFTKMDIKEIAFKLGFNDAPYFTRLFSKTVGCSPLHFRKNLK